MKRTAVAAMAVATLLGAGACNKSASANPQVSKEEAQAQAIVQKCAATANFLTSNGRKAFYACVAPPGQTAAVQSCATKALAKDGVLTHRARQRFEGDLATCIIPSPAPTAVPKGSKK